MPTTVGKNIRNGSLISSRPLVPAGSSAFAISRPWYRSPGAEVSQSLRAIPRARCDRMSYR